MNPPRADGATGERQEQPALQVRLKTDLAGLAPAYFDLVMATGIVSIAAHLQGWLQLSSTLFYLNNVMYVVLWQLTLGSASTISRELRRNAQPAGYASTPARACALQRRQQSRSPIKLHRDGILFGLMRHFLGKRWSPEQIALTLARIFPKGHPKLCNSTAALRALMGGSLRCLAEIGGAPLLTFSPSGRFRESWPAGRDCQATLDLRNCPPQTGRSGIPWKFGTVAPFPAPGARALRPSPVARQLRNPSRQRPVRRCCRRSPETGRSDRSSEWVARRAPLQAGIINRPCIGRSRTRTGPVDAEQTQAPGNG